MTKFMYPSPPKIAGEVRWGSKAQITCNAYLTTTPLFIGGVVWWCCQLLELLSFEVGRLQSQNHPFQEPFMRGAKI